MSYRIEQCIKGTVYVYQVTAYWDKHKKQPRQKRIYLGKKDAQTGELIPSKIHSINPRLCRDFGNFYFLKAVADHLELTSILKQVFPDLWKEILTCSFFEISEHKPLYLCDYWSRTTQTPENITISSQRISELLQMLGEQDNKRMAFFTTWAKSRVEKEYLAFDITSISSYSKMITMLEYGYNRDGEDLPQINMGMLFGQKSLLPIFYRLYPGSIRDMNTLENMIEYAHYLNIRKVHFVMDKGFYSSHNVAEMLKKQVKFAVAVPFTAGYAQSLVDAVRQKICTPSNSHIINGSFIYAISRIIILHGKRIQAFVYYDERAFLNAQQALVKRIMSLEDKLARKKSRPKESAYECLQYLTIRKTQKGMRIRRNDKKIAEALRYKGYLVIISNDIKEPIEALYLYRSKTSIERAFDNMKNELDLKRLRVHSDTSTAGRMFIGFITLILNSWINKRMQETKLFQKFTKEEVMCELKRLKIVELTSQRTLLTEISKTQKLLFTSFQIPLPRIT